MSNQNRLSQLLTISLLILSSLFLVLSCGGGGGGSGGDGGEGGGGGGGQGGGGGGGEGGNGGAGGDPQRSFGKWFSCMFFRVFLKVELVKIAP